MRPPESQVKANVSEARVLLDSVAARLLEQSSGRELPPYAICRGLLPGAEVGHSRNEPSNRFLPVDHEIGDPSPEVACVDAVRPEDVLSLFYRLGEVTHLWPVFEADEGRAARRREDGGMQSLGNDDIGCSQQPERIVDVRITRYVFQVGSLERTDHLE